MAEKEYIEREALIDHLKKSGAICGFGKYLIGNYPAADVAPVKHGEWLEIQTHNGCTPDYDCVCSVCGKSGTPNYNYCPNCGAKMDGDTNAENET